MNYYPDSLYAGDDIPDAPPADLHSKRLTESPLYSRAAAMATVPRTFSASRKLQQVLGIDGNKPEPYVRPPPMPQDLEQRFLANLQEYGVDVDLLMKDRMSQAARRQQKMGVGNELGKSVLEMIKEEKESPVSATHLQEGMDGLNVGLNINPPMWDLGYEAVSGGEYMGDRPSSAPCGNTNDYADTKYGYDPFIGYGSTTAFQDSQRSRPSSASAANTQLVFGQPDRPHMDSYAPATHNPDYDWIGGGDKLPQHFSSLANTSQFTGEQQAPYFHDGIQTQARNSYDLPKRVSSVPTVLFPPPRVEQQMSWDFVQTVTGDITPQTFALGGFAATSTNREGVYPMRPRSRGRLVPQIMVQEASPRKTPPPTTKKRRATSQVAPPAKVRASEDTAGLPILHANLEMMWKVKFPGNTYALLTIMLTWSLCMRRLSNLIPDPKAFSINGAFPYLVEPPIYQKLVSVSFYDTSVTPHKESRFLGPNDCAEMTYNEVDIFAYPDDTSAACDNLPSKADTVKRALGLNTTCTQVTDYKNISMSDRATTGEGRWSYILFRGHPSPTISSPTPPHFIIAWPTHATTNSSECLHTIYPDKQSAPRHFSSLQNLAATMRLQQSLRAASSEQLPEARLGYMEGAVTLKRRVVKMEKPGGVPLVEGYRVDVRRWEGWMEAVGKGKGKVMMWMER
ncbi:hypothetical protein HBI51_026540 [Parastagonospora nodorum]|nr:hypothetical protein HBI51_026540 [Parastagonospora nodorum]